jgi:hypothetical protein
VHACKKKKLDIATNIANRLRTIRPMLMQAVCVGIWAVIHRVSLMPPLGKTLHRIRHQGISFYVINSIRLMKWALYAGFKHMCAN